MNIAIMRTFTMVRKAIMAQYDAQSEITEIKKQLMVHEDKLFMIYIVLEQLTGKTQIDKNERNN